MKVFEKDDLRTGPQCVHDSAARLGYADRGRHLGAERCAQRLGDVEHRTERAWRAQRFAPAPQDIHRFACSVGKCRQDRRLPDTGLSVQQDYPTVAIGGSGEMIC
jgi:hypothetical protein